MQITIGTDAVRIVNRNSRRKSVTFTNLSAGGQLIYIDNVNPSGLTAGNAGYRLAPGGSISFITYFDGDDILQPFSGISSGAGAILAFKDLSERGE